MTTSDRARQVYLDLVATYQGAILNYAWRLVGDAELAEDITQETFTRAWRALDRLELDEGAEARRRAWLYRIAHNAATDHLRRKARLRWLPLDALRLGGGDPGPGIVAAHPVRLALARLSEDQRQVLLLFAEAGLSADEVAEVLGITAVAARKRRQRAREAFLEAWRAVGGDDETPGMLRDDEGSGE